MSNRDQTVEIGLATNQELMEELSSRFDSLVIAFSTGLNDQSNAFGMFMRGCPASNIGLFQMGSKAAMDRVYGCNAEKGENDGNAF